MANRVFHKCPRCGGPLEPATSISKQPSQFWFACTTPSCNTYINSYVPQEHQEKFHVDGTAISGNFGGFGTGKTTTSREEFYAHMFITPKGRTLIGANIAHQYENTIKIEIEQDFPLALVDSISIQKSLIRFKNGHTLMFRPLDDAGKLRSLNLSMFIVVEASEVNAEIFHQLKTRLRNTAAMKQLRDKHGKLVYEDIGKGVRVPVWEHNWTKGIIESNPDVNWIRSDVLLKSHYIQNNGRALDQYFIVPENADHNISSHIASSDVNKFLPPNYIELNSKNKPAWWVKRYLLGSFSYSEGLVYPSAMDAVVEPYDIPRMWKRCVAFDYGLNDNFAYIYGAINQAEGKIVIYREDVGNNLNLESLAKIYHAGTADIPSGGFAFPPLIDQRSGARRDYDKKTLTSHFLDYNIAFMPAQMNVDARVYRLNTYFEQGRVEIFNTCKVLIEELREYKFQPKTLDGSTKASDKPIDKNNHCINPLEWIVMELPADPSKLIYGAFNGRGISLEETREVRDIPVVPFALQDTEEDNEPDYMYL